ncbi:MAG: hypothetical protein ACRBBS_14670 [Thalassovita sp.]
MSLLCLHTADVHRATFDGLRDRITPGTPLQHIVREDWLLRAQQGVDGLLKAEVTQAIHSAAGPVICTCTTLGEVAEDAGAIRIDRPMMRRAAEHFGDIMLAYCLRSTERPSQTLLQQEMDDAGNPYAIAPLFLGHHWPLFEEGHPHAFARSVALDIRNAVSQRAGIKAVVLAQASMAGAAMLLSDLPAPVLASPVLALKEGLAQL